MGSFIVLVNIKRVMCADILNLTSQVADFGLAKFTSDANTHVSTRVMGTFGYGILFSFRFFLNLLQYIWRYN